MENYNIPNVIFVTDIGKDPDDTIALATLCKMHKNTFINIMGGIVNCGNFHTQIKRAKYLHGILSSYNINIPLSLGTPIYKTSGILSDSNSMLGKITRTKDTPTIEYNFPDKYLFSRFSLCPDKSITLLIISNTTEISRFAQDNISLFKSKVKNIFFMANAIEKDDKLYPDEMSYNVMYDTFSANKLCDIVRNSDIDLNFVPSYTIKTKPANKLTLDSISKSNNSLSHIVSMQKNAFHRRYRTAIHTRYNVPKYTLAHFLNNFTDLEVIKAYNFGFVWNHTTKIYMYDPITTLAVSPNFLSSYFKCKNFGNMHILECMDNFDPITLIVDILEN